MQNETEHQTFPCKLQPWPGALRRDDSVDNSVVKYVITVPEMLSKHRMQDISKPIIK